MTSSHKQPEPDQPPMASHNDLDEYVMPDSQHSDESDGTYSITMTPVSGSEYGGGDDEKEPLKPKESLPTTTAKESPPTTTAKESPPTTTASVSEAHAGTQSDLAPLNKVVWAKHARQARNSLQLSFSRGDILHVIGRENDDWYMAFNPAQPDNRGLVPVTYFRDANFWDTTLGIMVEVGLCLSVALAVLILLIFIFCWPFSGPTAPGTSSPSYTNQTQTPRCGPTKPFEGYHLLPAYNQTPYGILDCNHDATHAELLQSFFNKSTAATIAHFYNGRANTPEEINCWPWKRPVHEDSQALRDPEGSGLNKLTPEEWAIRWFFLEEDRPPADAEILPRLGFYREEVWWRNDKTSRRKRLDQYIAQMEVVRQETVRKTQLEIKELEDKTKKSEEKTRMKSETSHSDDVIDILWVLDKLGFRVKPEELEVVRETKEGN